MEEIKTRAKGLIFNIPVATSSGSDEKMSFHLDYQSARYREEELVNLVRDTVPFFALTEEERSGISPNTMARLVSKAWGRISDRPKSKKGDYGELLLFLLLETFFPARKAVTKVRIKTSKGMEVNGFDCSHFSFDEDDNISLWLGEAKFHKSFSSAIQKAHTSITEHLSDKIITTELSVLETYMEVEEPFRAKLIELLRSGISLDKMQFKFPILVTYDSSCIANHSDVSAEFKIELNKELEGHYGTIDGKGFSTPENIELVFILLSLKDVSAIKTELENIEITHK